MLTGRAALASTYAELISYVHEVGGARVTAAEVDELLEEERAELEERAAWWKEARRRRQRLQSLRAEEERLAAAARTHTLQKEEERMRRWSTMVEKGRATTAGMRRELLNTWGQAQLLIKETADIIAGLTNLGGGADPPAPPPFNVTSVISASTAQEEAEDTEGLLEPSRLALQAEIEKLQAAMAQWLAQQHATLKLKVDAHRAAIGDGGGGGGGGGDGKEGVEMRRSSGRESIAGLDDGSDYAQELRLELCIAQAHRSAEDAAVLEQLKDSAHEAAIGALLRRQTAVHEELAARLSKLRHYEQSTLPAYLASVREAYERRRRVADAQRQQAEEAERVRREAEAAVRRAAEVAAQEARVEAEARAEVERRRRLGDPMLSLVEPLLERCRKAGQPYVDESFRGDSALPPSQRGSRWRRAIEMSGKARLFPAAETHAAAKGHAALSAEDIKQGELGE